MGPEELLESGCVRETAKASCSLRIYVQPRASRTNFCGVHDNFLKLRITAPPVDNKANAMVIAVVAKNLKVPKSKVSIVNGKQSRQKTVRVSGVGGKDAAQVLAALM